MRKGKISNIRAVLRDFGKRVETIEKDVAQMWFDAGLEAIEQARNNADFNNWTNDLRSSFGVAVAVDGKIVKSNFTLRGDGKEGDGRPGLQEAQKYVDELMRDQSKGVALVLVAGRYYAGYVEAKGRNVLTAYVLDTAKELVNTLKQYANGRR